MIINFRRMALLVIVCSAMTGCASKDYVYCHDLSYSESMYMYLKKDPDYQKQLELMDVYFKEAESSGKKVAPGAYAHYALLKSKVGNNAESVKYLEMEKETFPDSAFYMNQLLNDAKNKQQVKTNTFQTVNPNKAASKQVSKGE